MDDPVKTELEFNEFGGLTAIHHKLEVDSLLDHNLILRNENGKGIRRTKTGNIHSGSMARHVAELDMVTYMDLHQRGILSDQKRFRKWLNDRDFRKYRVSEGKV